jgi:acyl-CoA reductase-like NAD-dependent aldehyde dehydrogenase
MLGRFVRPTLLSHTRLFATAASSDIPLTPLFINGERRPASDGRTFDVVNPTEQRIIGRGANASATDCTAAVDAAAAAQPAWEGMLPSKRHDVLLRAAEYLEKSRQQIRQTLNVETAATDAWGEVNVIGGTSLLRAATGMVSQLAGRSYPSELASGGHVIEQKRALGVVFSIAPWNAPVPLTVRAIAIPLLCGNAVVLKASEYSPATQSLVVDAFTDVI